MNAQFPSRLIGSLSILALPLLCTACSLSLSLDPKQGQNAAVARGSAMESSTATLVRLLESDDPQVRSVAVRGLAELGAEARGATPALHALIDDPDRHVRYEAVKAVAAVNPDDPALPAMLVQIANDQRTPEDQRIEMRSLLQRVSPMTASTASGTFSLDASDPSNTSADTGVESIETTSVISTPTTRPTGLEIRTEGPTTRPVMASERSEQLNESTNNGTIERSSEAPAPTTRPAMAPTTRPATRPASKNDWSEIPGLAGLADASAQDSPPTPDINLFGYQSYTSASAVQVKDWIQRQTSITEQEKQARVKEFQDWRYGQDKLIYQKVLER